ncbi:MAG: ribonuclease E activity regulator RraA [Candidatus Hydrogenedentota bacterium]
MPFRTADLCDHFAGMLWIAEKTFVDFGGTPIFSGAIETVRVFEDNSRVRECVGRTGGGKVLVVDGGGSMRRALLGGNLAENAVANGWSGLVINGCIRDSAEIGGMALGVKALGTHPQKTARLGMGDHNVPVRFAGVTFRPGMFVYADEDGIVASERALELPDAGGA